MWVGVSQSIKLLNRTKRQRKGEVVLCLTVEMGHWSSPALGLALTPSVLQFSGLQAWAGTIPLAFLGLQLAGGRLWDFSASFNMS